MKLIGFLLLAAGVILVYLGWQGETVTAWWSSLKGGTGL